LDGIFAVGELKKIHIHEAKHSQTHIGSGDALEKIGAPLIEIAHALATQMRLLRSFCPLFALL
jgi:hypothetical protein